MNDIRLIQLNSYVRPAIIESKSKDWVLNGKNNSFYDDLIDSYTGSTTNSSIINTYADLIYGRGLGTSSKQTSDVVKLAQTLNKKELRKAVVDFVLYGEACLQVLKNKGGDIAEIAHVDKKNIAPNKENEDGEIEGYWYCEDWNKQGQNPPEFIPAFGTSNEAIEIYNIKTYRAGKTYFTDPEWVSAIPYCQLEKEQSNFYLKSIKQGLSAGYIINIPDGNSLTDEEKADLERQIKAKLTGSPNALNFILSFNGRDAEITIIPFPVNEQMHKQWDYLNEVSLQKILTSHRCTSPSIVGVISSSGFSNTADEMDMAQEQLIKRVIQPKQNVIIDALEEILTFYGINLNLFFKPLSQEQAAKSESFTGIQISSAVEVIQNVKTGGLTREQAESILRSMLSYPESEIDKLFKDVVVQPTPNITNPLSLSDDNCCHTDNIADEFIALGEEISDEWELIDEVEAIDLNLKENMLNTVVQLAVNTPAFDKPRRTESEQDTSIFKIRYKYEGNPSPQREFCKKVISANKVYRAEDLDKEQKTAPNMGKGGSNTYNVFLYKGGVNCKHFWQRQIYMKKGFKKLSVNQARRMILELEPGERKAAKWEENPKEVAQTASPSNNFWKVN
jgi:hypothetical protein